MKLCRIDGKYVCDECGLTFVLDLDPVVRCATHGDSGHCHVGELIICADGSHQRAAIDPPCIPFASH